jgi:hypothetical protein
MTATGTCRLKAARSREREHGWGSRGNRSRPGGRGGVGSTHWSPPSRPSQSDAARVELVVGRWAFRTLPLKAIPWRHGGPPDSGASRTPLGPRPQSLGAGGGQGHGGVPPERAAEDREPYRGILYEPPYSLWQAAAGVSILAIGRLLSRRIWGD